jgi:uncharacterized membrane protein
MNSQLTVRRIVVAGLLGAIVILLGVTRLGFVAVPTPFGDATIMHIPVIIGGVLEGTVVGAILGLFFGLLSFMQATVPAFKDPLVAILPRLFIGVTAALSYRALRRWNEPVAVAVSAIVGTLTNTILVLGIAVLRGYVSLEVAIGLGITHGIPEVIVAVIIVGAVVLAWKGLATRQRKADL